MRDAEFLDVLDQVDKDVAFTRKHLRSARRNNAEYAGLGYSSRSGAGGVRGGGHSDSTGDAASSALDQELHPQVGVRAAIPRVNQMRKEHAEAEADLETVRLAAFRLRRYVTAYTTHKAGKFAEPSCRSCARVGKTSVIYASERCRWCYDLWRALGDDPHPELVRMHCEHKRITTSLIVGHHPGYGSTPVDPITQGATSCESPSEV